MSNINNLTSQDTVVGSDQIPIYSNGNGNTNRVSASALATYVQSQTSSVGDLMTQYAAPSATGFVVNITPLTNGESVFLLLTPVAGYASGAILMPLQATCLDGQQLLVSSTQAVTSLTVSGNGSTMNGAPTTIAANGFFRMRYDGVFKAWYRAG